jgi:hypothetical protein
MNGDDEIRCWLSETNVVINVNYYPSMDWANPGCQHKNQFGPKVTP